MGTGKDGRGLGNDIQKSKAAINTINAGCRLWPLNNIMLLYYFSQICNIPVNEQQYSIVGQQHLPPFMLSIFEKAPSRA